MNKFERLKEELASSGTGKMKAFGSSMLPILKSGTLLTFEKVDDYGIGDIVFCKVKGRYIDAHKVVKTDTNKVISLQITMVMKTAGQRSFTEELSQGSIRIKLFLKEDK